MKAGINQQFSFDEVSLYYSPLVGIYVHPLPPYKTNQRDTQINSRSDCQVGWSGPGYKNRHQSFSSFEKNL
jgi:hypothetical protein